MTVKKTEENIMKGTVLARTLLGLAVLMLIGATALAADKSTITINGGRTTVQMKAPSKVVHNKIKPPVNPFYDSVGTGYDMGVGYTTSDGSPIGTEYSPGIQFIALKSGTTKKVSVGLGWVEGTFKEGIVVLDKDCKGIPCGTIDKTNLCMGKVFNLPTFGSTATTVRSFNCAVKLTKGKPYWVYVASTNNSWLAWNLAATALGGVIEGTNDVWGTPSSNSSVGAVRIN
jgi:hypothetical protein